MNAREEHPAAAPHFAAGQDRAEHREEQRGGELAAEILGEQGVPKNILLVHEILPHYDCSGADLRLYELVRELRALGHRVTFLGRDKRDELRYRPPLEALGAKVFAGDPARLRHAGCDDLATWELREVLQRGHFDIAILSHWFWSGISVAEHYMDEIRCYSPETRVLVLSEDRHGERERRSAKLTGYISDLERGNEFEQREAEIYARADLVLFVTESDEKRFLELVPGLATEHLPTISEAGSETSSEAGSAGAGFSAREGVLFLGNFENLANRDALQWMLEKVWPIVRRKEPALRLYIAGHAAPEGLEKHHAGIRCLGKIAELGPQFDLRRVFAAPIRYGTGIITKNMHALAHRLPVVTTVVGAEGLQLQDGVQALIADEPAEFAAAILRLYRDEQLWKNIATTGQAYILSKFSLANLQSQIRKIVVRACKMCPRDLEPGHEWSYRKVEASCPWILTENPPRYRPMLRTLTYWQLGKKYLAEGQPEQALEQFRHVFSFLRGPLPDSVFHHALLTDMATCYRQLGNASAAHLCDEEHHKCLWQWDTKLSANLTVGKKNVARNANAAEISVVFPTYNRSAVLRVSLAAWAFNSLPAERWEVVIVDDGSTDDTAELCRETLPFRVTYVHQPNQGAGSARRKGVETAQGEFLLLCNDDSIASSNLLVEHLSVHRKRGREKIAVLGEFRASEALGERALSLFVNTSVFFFPHGELRAGQSYDRAYFMTCNLSVRRDIVLGAGNFDASFRVSEDSELGTRLMQRGLRVVYHPAAVAWHEHVRFTSQDLVLRAQAYGSATWDLFQKHPQLLRKDRAPFGLLAPEDEGRLQSQVDQFRVAVANGVAALESLDQMDFRDVFKDQVNGPKTAAELMSKVGQLATMIYWHYLYQSFLERWHETRPALAVPSSAEPQPAVRALGG